MRARWATLRARARAWWQVIMPPEGRLTPKIMYEFHAFLSETKKVAIITGPTITAEEAAQIHPFLLMNIMQHMVKRGTPMALLARAAMTAAYGSDVEVMVRPLATRAEDAAG